VLALSYSHGWTFTTGVNVQPGGYAMFMRLGMKCVDGRKPRPLRFRVASMEKMSEILKSARNLKESKFYNIYISQDCTPREIEDRNKRLS